MLFPLVACGRLGFDGSDSPGTPGVDASSTSDGSTTDGVIIPSTWAVADSPPPTTADLWAAYAFSPTDLWVAGTTGTIQHFTGSWATTTSSATTTLFMFWGSASDLWLIGRSCAAQRWMGASWTPTSVPGCSGNQDLMSINGTDAANIWVSGIGGNIQQYTTVWTSRSQGNVDYWDTRVNSATDVIAIGTQGTIEHWNGSTYTAEPSGTTQTLAAITSPAPGEYWVVGGAGTILHKLGAGAWTAVSSPTTVFLYDVIAISPTDLWAVGSTGVILHGDGTSWVQVASPTANTLRNLEPIPGGGIMAVGTGGTLLVHP
ncbi:MAG TPA: hypothetical protein VLB44_18430 [Kofleriaceae bacterium]|nr:hypothetical protein [Kofleriaceae bacterium]